MTFWDNPQMVINHIRHSCVTSDDTGMCEMVIVQDEPDLFNNKQRKKLVGAHIEDTPDYSEYSQTFDIAVSPGVMGRTPKAGRYDKTKRSKQEHHCKNIHWSENKTLTDEERNELFEEKILPNISTTTTTQLNNNKNNISTLSSLLQDTLNTPSNPFISYAKFDGEGLEDTCPTKTIDFFLTFLPTEGKGTSQDADVKNQEERLQPMSVTFIDQVNVQDVIGLVLCKYTLEGKKPRLQGDVKSYALHIAEEDGEVDTDFPALDEKEAMSKFGFQNLAIVAKHKINRTSGSVKSSVSVKISVPQNGYSVVKVDRTDVKMKVVLAKLVKKRGLKKNGREYRLEKPGEEGKHVDMEATLESTGSLTFNLVRDNGSSRRREEKDIETKTSSAQAEIMSLQYKSYQVSLLHRLLTSTEVSLGIHGQKIEIDPVSQPKSQRIFTRVKPVSLDVNIIADCEIMEEKTDRSIFRIYYKKSDDFKHYEFDATRQIAVKNRYPKCNDQNGKALIQAVNIKAQKPPTEGVIVTFHRKKVLSKDVNVRIQSRPHQVRAEFLQMKKRTLEKTKKR